MRSCMRRVAYMAISVELKIVINNCFIAILNYFFNLKVCN